MELMTSLLCVVSDNVRDPGLFKFDCFDGKPVRPAFDGKPVRPSGGGAIRPLSLSPGGTTAAAVGRGSWFCCCSAWCGG